MKFQVGQPVWAIGHISGKWIPAEVTEMPSLTNLYIHGKYVGTFMCYRVSCGKVSKFLGVDSWSVEEKYLRPRDPDQHTPSMDFNWRDLTRGVSA